MSALQDSLHGTDYGVALLSQEVTALHHTRSPRCSGSLLRGSLAITTTGLAPVSHQDLSRRTNRLLAGVPERKIETMTKAAEALLADALRLSPEVRAELAAELLASLDGPADPDAEAAWAAEIERRVDAIEAGSVALEPWDEVKRRIEKDLLGR